MLFVHFGLRPELRPVLGPRRRLARHQYRRIFDALLTGVIVHETGALVEKTSARSVRCRSHRRAALRALDHLDRRVKFQDAHTCQSASAISARSALSPRRTGIWDPATALLAVKGAGRAEPSRSAVGAWGCGGLPPQAAARPWGSKGAQPPAHATKLHKCALRTCVLREG